MPSSPLRVDSKALREARARVALTQDEVAEKAGIHPVTYCRVETGQQPPLAKTVRKIASALGVEPSEIVSIR